MGNKLTKKAKDTFESIKRLDENGEEWWSSRELAKALTYSDYGYFLEVMRKAWKVCQNMQINPHDHFRVYKEMVQIGSGAEREIDTVKISRYGCYIVVMNANSSKTIVSQAQTYFAIQTRRAELLLDKDAPLTEEEQKRLFLRREMKSHNTQLAGAAREAGVTTSTDYAIFQNKGYEGLYGGLDQKAIHERKGLGKSQNILDHMGSTELAANLFRATQTEEKLRREEVKGKAKANEIHKQIGAKVRKTIREIGGAMPEDLPTVDSIKNSNGRKNGNKTGLTRKIMSIPEIPNKLLFTCSSQLRMSWHSQSILLILWKITFYGYYTEY